MKFYINLNDVRASSKISVIFACFAWNLAGSLFGELHHRSYEVDIFVISELYHRTLKIHKTDFSCLNYI